ncbi:MAG: recombinase RecA [Cenarchaeum symbiont of Oopsacas minuta]|nr:recombinase RecA [Cenarchaeum symbiont of Oopsacas minuta]
MISSGIRQVDKILRGGIRAGTITDIFGSAGSGKTQLAMQFCVNAASDGGNVIYHDTSGHFRPERIVQMARDDSQLLERIKVYSTINTSEQISALSTICKGTTLAVVDAVTDLFSFEYKQMSMMREKNVRFMRYMHKLTEISYEYNIPIVITNMVRNSKDRIFENMNGATSPFTHVKIQLFERVASNVPRRGTVETVNGKYEFEYEISKKGVFDARAP